MMTRMFKHVAMVLGGLGATVLVAGCSALGIDDDSSGTSRSSDRYDDSRSASGRYDSYDRYDSTYDRSGSSRSGQYDSSTGRYDSTPGYNDYKERQAKRAADRYNGEDRTYEERKAARRAEQYRY